MIGYRVKLETLHSLRTPGTMPGETVPWMAAARAAFEG